MCRVVSHDSTTLNELNEISPEGYSKPVPAIASLKETCVANFSMYALLHDFGWLPVK